MVNASLFGQPKKIYTQIYIRRSILCVFLGRKQLPEIPFYVETDFVFNTCHLITNEWIIDPRLSIFRIHCFPHNRNSSWFLWFSCVRSLPDVIHIRQFGDKPCLSLTFIINWKLNWFSLYLHVEPKQNQIWLIERIN